MHRILQITFIVRLYLHFLSFLQSLLRYQVFFFDAKTFETYLKRSFLILKKLYRSISPWDWTLKVLALRARVNLGAIAMKVGSIPSKSLGVESPHQIWLCSILRTIRFSFLFFVGRVSPFCNGLSHTLSKDILTLSRHPSLSSIASGRSRVTSCIGTELLYVGFSWSSCICSFMWRGPQDTSLMSSSLLLQQCSPCLDRLTLIFFVMGGRWP